MAQDTRTLTEIGTDRRTFMRRGAMGVGALWMVSLGELVGRRAYGSPAIESPYGPISPKLDQTTGLPLLQLPDGFRYWSHSWTGDVMSDGVGCPSLHDGMAVVDEFFGREPKDNELPSCDPDEDDPHRDRRHEGFTDGRNDFCGDRDDHRSRTGRLVLVRNHEPATGAPYLNDPSITYAGDGAGGTTNLIFNPREGRFEKVWSSLAGTVRNCAGGVTPWGTWVTCEESDVTNHGWNFEVGAVKGIPNPLTAMGRFSHEANMIDPRTGYVYETEDAGPSGFYKFVPNSRGKLWMGGALYMLAVKNQLNINLSAGGALAHPIGTMWDVTWVRIDDPRAATTSCYKQGEAKGGAAFARLEGAWWGDRTGFFLTTNGGVVGEGQVFEYDPRAETLKLIYDAPNANDLDNPDNITVTPRGGLLLCEDAAGNNFIAGERLVGLTLDGETFTFAQNNINLTAGQIAGAGKTIASGDYRQSEWAGACYSPDGKWLFVNIQTPGITFAIKGPWGKGPL
jgi:uncharacterized protein